MFESPNRRHFSTDPVHKDEKLTLESAFAELLSAIGWIVLILFIIGIVQIFL